MTLNEFQAWFDGFTEDMKGPPNAKQWARIQERVKEISGTPVSYPVYVDHYWRRPYWSWNDAVIPTSVTSSSATEIAAIAGSGVQAAFHGVNAMYAAGKADAEDFH